jgi:surfeit locus 1 family protein
MKSLIFAVTAALLVAAFSVLGHWQLQRAAEQDALVRQFLESATLPALDVLPDSSVTTDVRYRRVALRGRYVPRVQVLLDNMTHEGAVGYHVLTLFVPSSGGSAVVVNRGWLPASPDRSRLPVVDVAVNQRLLRGRIAHLPVPALRLADDVAALESKPPLKVMTFPRHQDLERILGRPLVPYQVLLDPPEADGYLRAWKPPVERADRNRAYAGQWFLLAAATVLGAVGLAVRDVRRRRKRA